MSFAFQSNDSVKMALYEELQNILSPDTSIRTAAEARLKQLEYTDGYGVYMAELIMNQSSDLALRQCAAVMLPKYVDAHWSALESSSGDGPNGGSGSHISDQVKKIIRDVLPNGLYDPNSKIRSSVAFCISTIASQDWPEQWTDLFDIIVKCLSGPENSVHGAIQVLTEFSHDLDSQIAVVGPTILSEVYRIFEADSQYTVDTRASAVLIIKQLFKSINEHVDLHANKERMLLPLLPTFVERMMQCLGSQDPLNSSFRLKSEIVHLLTFMVNEMPRFVQPYTAQVLPTIWLLLTQTADLYVKSIVNGDPEAEGGPDAERSAADDEHSDLFQFRVLVLQQIELIQALVESGKFKAAIRNVLTDLIYIMIVYMQFTQEQLADWSDDTDQFVDEDYQEQEGSHGSIRITAQDVLLNIAQDIGAGKVLDALSAALARHASVAEAEQAAGSEHWWKIHEASIRAVGTYRPLIADHPGKFDLSQYLNYVRRIMAGGQLHTPYLLGRCLWLLCRFSNSQLYGAQMCEEIMATVESSLTADKPAQLRVFAVQTILEVCNSLKDLPDTDERKRIVAGRLGPFLDGIIGSIALGGASVLSLALETITLMTQFDAAFTAGSHPKIIPLTTAVFLKHHDDPYLLSHVQDILRNLCQNPFSLAPLQEKMVPTLVSILNVQGEHKNNALQEIALDILATLIKYAEAPLAEPLIAVAFPAAIECVLHTEDHSIMQSGGECLRAFVYVAPQQVFAFRNGEGLNCVMRVATKLLNPLNTEYSAAFVGRLVITIISRAGNLIGDHIYLLLKAVISKMQLVETLSVSMSLVMTFAHLFVTQMEAVLNFLSTVPGPDGEPAIQYVFGNWLSRQHMFYGTYERKVSTMALCKLFEHGVTTQDVRLTAVTIREAQQPAGSGARTRVTRAQAANPVWTSVPVLVKIFKLMLSELANLREVRLSGELTDDDEDDEDEGVDSGDEAVMRTSDLMFDEEPADDDDQLMQDLMRDPVFQANMEEMLTKFLQTFSREEAFKAFVAHLNDAEKHILQSIQIAV